MQLTDKEVELLESKTKFDVGFPTDFIGEDWRVTGKKPPTIAAQGPILLTR